jgi:hypothetical protein
LVTVINILDIFPFTLFLDGFLLVLKLAAFQFLLTTREKEGKGEGEREGEVKGEGDREDEEEGEGE